MVRYTVNASILLTDRPLLERPAAAAEAGFGAVEFWWPWATAVPGDAEVDAFVRAVRDAGVQLTGLNFFAGDMPGGERGLVSQPARAAEFRDNIDVVVGIGEQLGCRGFNALYGLRGADADVAASEDVALENLLAATAAVARLGGTVLIEPVSGAADYPLLTARDALDVVDRVRGAGGGSIALLADFFHLATNGDDVAAAIEEHAADFGHIQIADAPGRGEPGTGDLPLAAWIERSHAVGFEGWVGLEYKTDAADPFAWLPRDQRGVSA